MPVQLVDMVYGVDFQACDTFNASFIHEVPNMDDGILLLDTAVDVADEAGVHAFGASQSRFVAGPIPLLVQIPLANIGTVAIPANIGVVEMQIGCPESFQIQSFSMVL